LEPPNTNQPHPTNRLDPNRQPNPTNNQTQPNPNRQLAVEYHKRFDPIYSDARNRARTLGPFSYFYSYMAQPKVQLDTFKAWAGLSSDINYYLNSHHIDIHNWMAGHAARPVLVSALAATGVAERKLGRSCEDTITLSTRWRAEDGGSEGTAVYTASWIAPKVCMGEGVLLAVF
jgi:D-galacturonate reductase